MNPFNLEFVGIGAAKAGTTWLATCLAEHPQICMSRPKELNYFCTRHVWPPSPTFYDEGERWLQTRFSHWKTEQIRGEFSVSYLIDPESPALIYKRFPNTKLIISFRNPTDGLYSFYYELVKQYSVPKTFEDFMDQYPDFIDYGFYYTHVKRYLEFFDVKQVHFIVFDEICAKPDQVLKNLFGSLGVNPDYSPPSLRKRVNERRAPRSLFIRNFVGNTTDFFRTDHRARRFKGLMRALGTHHIANWIQARNLHVATLPSMKQETRCRLVDIYSEENQALGILLNKDLSHWNSK